MPASSNEEPTATGAEPSGAAGASSSMEAPPALRLHLVAGPCEGQVVEVRGPYGLVTRGRAGTHKVAIKDQAISERHAELAWDGSAWQLQDVQSSNGTKLNGARLEPWQRVALADGDEVALGSDTVARVEVQAQSLAALSVEQLLHLHCEMVARKIEERAQQEAQALRQELEALRSSAH